MHITSLPEGELGADAFRFVDWLVAAGQSWWQMLPLGPPDRYRSPYKSRSAFAAWPGLLSGAARRSPVSAAEVLDFRERNAFWIDDWERFAGREAVEDQVRFEREWTCSPRLRAERGVRLIGDIAIYVAPRGAPTSRPPELFQDAAVAGTHPTRTPPAGSCGATPSTTGRRSPAGLSVVVGAPARGRLDVRHRPDRPLPRIRRLLGCPGGRRARSLGSLGRGPGRAVFDAMTGPWTSPRRCRWSPRIWGSSRRPSSACATSSGSRHAGAPVRLRAQAIPMAPTGSRTTSSGGRLHGTHDQDTAAGVVRVAGPSPGAVSTPRSRAWRARAMVVADPAALDSPARVAMIQAQDVLGLGSEARMNLRAAARELAVADGAGCADKGGSGAPAQRRNRRSDR